MVSQAAHAATAMMTRIQSASISREGACDFDGPGADAKRGKCTGQKLTLRIAAAIGAKPDFSQNVRLIRLSTQEVSTSWLFDSSTRNLAAQATIGRNSSWS